MNGLHNTIKFTIEYSDNQINFLDTTTQVDKTTGKIYTTLYTKETDKHAYYTTQVHTPHTVKQWVHMDNS